MAPSATLAFVHQGGNAVVTHPSPMTLREQILWTLFGLALLAVFLVLLVQDQLA
jgi:hypothetical protein